nr:MAG TPA: replisome organizer [Bacteriophage sp.]
MMATYPNFKLVDVDFAANTWANILSDCTYDQASLALKAYIRSDSSGFAPSPGQLIDKMQNFVSEKELNEIEAWSLVNRAIKNSGYNSVEEFEKLPGIVKRAVGSPEQLRAWALDCSYNESVVSSQFMRTYRIESARKIELKKLPSYMNDIIKAVNENACSGLMGENNNKLLSAKINKSDNS